MFTTALKIGSNLSVHQQMKGWSCCCYVASVVSDSVRPHRRQPTRLLCPLDFPGKSTGVGCHCLLQCMKVKSESEVGQLCPTLSDPMDCSPPGSFVHGIFQARVLESGAISFSIKDEEYVINMHHGLGIWRIKEQITNGSQLMVNMCIKLSFCTS